MATRARAVASSLLRVDLGQRQRGRLVVDPAAAELLAKSSAGQAPTGLPGPDEGPGELGVVDQTDLLEPVEHAGGHLRRRPLGAELGLQLGSAARRRRQRGQHDRADDRLRVGRRREVGVAARRRLVRPARSVRPTRGTAVGPPSAQKSTFASATEVIAVTSTSAGASSLAPTPSFSWIFFSISSARSGLSCRKRAGVLLALAELVALVGVPSAGLADDALLDAHVDQAALAARCPGRR